jgi:type IV secretion system protein VirD4
MRPIRILTLAVLLLAGLWAATRYAAGTAATVPAPWALLVWSIRDRTSQPTVDRALAGFAAYAVCVVGIVSLFGRGGPPRVKAFGTSGWGDRGDLRRAGLLGGGGTVVGVHRGRLLTFDGPEHQLVAGASRSGKGVGHVIPTLLCWGGSALVYDVKGELWEATAGYRSRYQHCLFFNPTRPGGAHYNPLLEVRKGPHEVRDVQNLVEQLVNPDGSKRTLDVWDQNASQFLVGLVLHVLYAEPDGQKHIGRVRDLLLDFNATCAAMMTTPHRPDPATGEPQVYPEVARVAKSLLGQAERFRSSVRGTAEGYLTLWADEVVREVTSRSDFAAGDLTCLERPVTLYLQPPPSDAARVRPLVRLVLNQVTRALLESRTADARGRPKRHRLLVLLDEFPTLGRLPSFADSLRQMAGYGLKAQLVVQSFNDVAEQYGPHNTIVDNCHVLCCFASADTVTCQRVSTMTGEAVEYRESYSGPRDGWAGGRGGRRSVSQSEHVRPLLTPGQVRTLPYDQQLVFVTGFRPFRTPKLRYYERADLLGRVIDPPPRPEDGWRPAGSAAAADDWAGERAKGDRLPLPAELGAGTDDEDEPPPPAAAPPATVAASPRSFY